MSAVVLADEEALMSGLAQGVSSALGMEVSPSESWVE